MPVVRGGSGGGVYANKSSGKERHRPGVLGENLPPPPLGEAQTYQVSFPEEFTHLQHPMVGYQGGGTNRTNLQVHFMHCHVRDTIVILEEGNRPYPCFPTCDMFVYHDH